MHLVEPENYDRISARFQPDRPNSPILFSVLEGRNPGKVWVNSSGSIETCLVRAGSSGYSGFLGVCADSTLKVAVETLRAEGDFLLIVESNEIERFRPFRYKTIPRIEFLSGPGHRSRLRKLESEKPAGMEFQAIDEKTFKKCTWYKSISSEYGGEARFRKFGKGLCLNDGETIASEVYAAFIGRNIVEIGAVTHESFRGRGLSAVVCARFFQELLDAGLVPYWSCMVENKASVRVAEKLGFSRPKPYALLQGD